MLRKLYLVSLTFVLLGACTITASTEKSRDSKQLPTVKKYKLPPEVKEVFDSNFTNLHQSRNEVKP